MENLQDIMNERRSAQGQKGPGRKPGRRPNRNRRGSSSWPLRLSLLTLAVLLVQTVCEVIFAVQLIRLHVLPTRYLLLVLLALVIALVIPALLIRFRNHRPSIIRIVLGILCSLLVMGLTVSGMSYVRVTNNTIDKVTTGGDKDHTYTSAIVSVYVLKEDPAESLEDARDYEFGTLGSMDLDNTEKAVQDIEDSVGQKIQTSEKESVEKLAASLYNQEVGAIILNQSYADLLTSSSAYEDFSDRTRILENVKIKDTVTAAENAAGRTSSSGGSSKGGSSKSGSSGSDGNGSGTDTSGQKTSTKVTTGSGSNAEKVTNNVFAVYLSGSDTRSEILDTSRSDVNIILIVDPVGKQMLMLNTPRDYYIANPAGNGAKDKLTHCGLQGMDNSIEALSDLYGIDIDYSAQINFNGFKKMIDALGGVTVFSDADFTAGGYSFHKGQNDMDGTKALVFCRERKSFSDGDESRGRHQMAVIKGMLQKAASKKGVLTNYADIMNSLQGMFTTSLSSEEVAGLIRMQIDDMAAWNIRSYAVTGSDGMEKTWSMPDTELYVMYPDESSVKKAKSLIKKLKKGEVISGSDVAS